MWVQKTMKISQKTLNGSKKTLIDDWDNDGKHSLSMFFACENFFIFTECCCLNLGILWIKIIQIQKIKKERVEKFLKLC